jgi:ABC-2 type transport system permease protein
MTGELTFTRAVRLVAGRELTERARDRSFQISGAVMMLIIIAVVVLPQLVGGGATSYDVAVAGADATALSQAIQHRADTAGLHLRVHTAGSQDAARTQVRDGRVAAAVADGRVTVEQELPAELRPALVAGYQDVAGAAALRRLGIDAGTVAGVYASATLATDVLKPRDRRQESGRAIAFVGSVLLFGQLLGYSIWVASGVVEEKSTRVVEILLSAVPARALLVGKILGIGLLGLVQLLVLAIVGVTTAVAAGELTLTADAIYPVALVVVWYLLGYAFYATCCAALAARVSRQEELQSVTTPATMLLMLSYFASIFLVTSPDSGIGRVLSFIPPFSVIVAPTRAAGGQSALWESAVSALLMIAVTVLLVFAAGRLYEGAVLHAGAKVRFADAWNRRRGGQARTG